MLFLGAIAAVAVVAVIGVRASHSGKGSTSRSGSSVAQQTSRAATVRRKPVRLDPGAGLPGYILIADRGNDRLLLVDGRKHILWRYPGTGGPKVPFYFDDDSFFGSGYRTIITNQEEQHTIQIVSFPGGKVLWRYGHVGVRGSAPGYLNTPDDAYLLPHGLVSVADAYNCRVLFIARATKRIARQIGTAGVCRHDPPRSLGAVNGATPLADGGVLVSEINGSWIDDFGPAGQLRWSVQAPVSYPSDPQLLAPNRILLADYRRPGAAVLMTRTGKTLWRYQPTSGSTVLDHPSLATRIAPGVIAINDDFRHRVVLVSLRTKKVIWQYGRTDVKGTGADYLNTPDGLDLLPTAVAQRIPTIRRLVVVRTRRPAARRAPGRAGSLLVTNAPFTLTAPVEREVAVSSGGRILLAGGLDASLQSASGIYSLDPRSGRMRRLGDTPQAFHDAAGAVISNRLLVFGGGSTAGVDTVQAFDLARHTAGVTGRLPRPLSDLGAVSSGRTTYLVGGYDGITARGEVYATTNGTSYRTVALLPVGLRYPAVAAASGRILIAGGATNDGEASAVYAVDPVTGKVSKLGHLPAPVGHASALTIRGDVYVFGGRNPGGAATSAITRIDPVSGSITPAGRLPQAVADAAAVQTGPSSGLLIGGWRNHTVAQVVRVAARVRQARR